MCQLSEVNLVGQALRLPSPFPIHINTPASDALALQFVPSRQSASVSSLVFSGGDLAQNSAQLVKVHRFRKVEIEPGFPAALNILARAKAGERDRLDRSSSLGLGNDVVAAAVRQSDVAQDNIELFRVNHVQRILCSVSRRNFMAEMIEKTRQRLQRVAVIFDHQDTQTPA